MTTSKPDVNELRVQLMGRFRFVHMINQYLTTAFLHCRSVLSRNSR